MSDRYRVDSETPCCHAPVRLMATQPQEQYIRKCAICGTRWRIERASKVIETGLLAGTFADMIGWNKV